MMGRLFMALALVLSLGLFTVGCKKDEPVGPDLGGMNDVIQNEAGEAEEAAEAAAAEAEKAAAEAAAEAEEAAKEAANALEGMGSN